MTKLMKIIFARRNGQCPDNKRVKFATSILRSLCLGSTKGTKSAARKKRGKEKKKRIREGRRRKCHGRSTLMAILLLPSRSCSWYYPIPGITLNFSSFLNLKFNFLWI